MRQALAVILAIGCSTVTAPRERMRGAPPTSELAARMDHVLRELVLYEEAYFADSVDYTGDLTRLTGWFDRPPKFDPQGVIVRMLTVDGTGWSAVATDEWGLLECRIYVGSGTHEIEGVLEGEPRCEMRHGAVRPAA
jgi:hypothetical protein